MSDPAHWYNLGKVHYQKWKVYDMEWKESLSDLQGYHVCCAPFSGPIAMIRDSKRLMKVASGKKVSPTLKIFNSAGKLLVELQWTYKPMVGMGWTDEMKLACICQDGTVICFTAFGEVENSFAILPPNSKDKVTKSYVWGSGAVVLTESFLLIQITSIDSVRPHFSLMKEAGFGKDNPPTCMAVLEPRFVKSGQPEVFLGTSNCSIRVVSKSCVLDMELKGSIKQPIVRMSIAPNGMFMAIFTQDGILTVLNTSFDNKVLSFDTQSGSIPLQMLWCGEDSVLLFWKQLGLIMVGPFGGWTKVGYDEAIVLLQEADCCRIFSRSNHEILRRVPSSIESIKRLGSTDPSALLFDALETFDSGDAKADESIRSIQSSGDLENAVLQCIDAAGADFDQAEQMKLFRAASYGKCFCEDFDAETFVEMCRKVRVLNAIRSPSVAMPLTLIEYDLLTPEVVINRLVKMNNYFLAFKICNYLKVTTDRVLVHWACEKVKKAKDVADEVIVSVVRKKLKDATMVSYAEIASCAEKINRRRLATMLLDLEERPADQIPLLLSMGEFELAIRKAVQAKDPDLIYMALLHIEATLKSPSEFKYVLTMEEDYQNAVDLIVTYYRQTKSSLSKLEPFWLDSNGIPTVELGSHEIRMSYKITNMDERVKKLKLALDTFIKAKANVHIKATEDQIDLLEEQFKIENKTRRNYIGMSISDTIKSLCFDSADDSRLFQFASALSKKFKVPDKRYYRVKIRALADSRQWDVLFKFSQEKKSPPCGFKPFALVCFDAGEFDQAESYASRITASDEKFETFVHMEMWTAALEVAVREKDPEKLSSVRNQCSDPEIHEQVDFAAQQLGFIS